MKTKLLALALGALLAMPCMLHAEDYYWYGNEKIMLERGTSQYIIFQDDLLKESDKEKLENSGDDVTYPGYTNLKWGVTKSNAIIEDTEHVLYQMPSFRFERANHDSYVTHRFYVKLKSNDDLPILQEMADQYQAGIEELVVLKYWHVLRCGFTSSYNALDLANIFYESGSFAAVEPEFIYVTEFLANPQVSANPSQKSAKLIRDGQLYIQSDGAMYNAEGIRIK